MATELHKPPSQLIRLGLTCIVKCWSAGKTPMHARCQWTVHQDLHASQQLLGLAWR